MTRNLDLVYVPAVILGVPVAIAWAYAVYLTIRARQRVSQSSRLRRAGTSLVMVLLILAGFLALAIVPPWFQATVPWSSIRRTEIRMLTMAEIAYGVAILTAAVALIPLVALSIQRRRSARGRIWTTRGLALVLSLLMAALAAEGQAWACLWASSIPMPWLPVRFEDRPGEKVVDILVVGESKHRGVPYDKWFSVADIVVWKLEAAFPKLNFRIENQAAPGLSLQAMHTLLGGIRRRPELVILYAGHNEFQSRFDWGHGAIHYADETLPATETLQGLARRISPMMRLMGDHSAEFAYFKSHRRVFSRGDWLTFQSTRRKNTSNDAGSLAYAWQRSLPTSSGSRAQVVLVIPPGNDAGFEPNRSFLASNTPRDERERFATEFAAARAAETTDPAVAEKMYRRFLERQPQFAEGHFRLARLLERSANWDEAFPHYVAARDLDGLPMRLPSDFQQVYKSVAARHPRAILVDGPAEFHASTDHGLIGDSLFTDGLHPSLNGYTILAQAILRRLHERRVFPWPAQAPVPSVTALECANRFQIGAKKWQSVCEYAVWFYNRTAYIRYDPAERLAKARRYAEAARELKSDKPVDSAKFPGVGPLSTRR